MSSELLQKIYLYGFLAQNFSNKKYFGQLCSKNKIFLSRIELKIFWIKFGQSKIPNENRMKSNTLLFVLLSSLIFVSCCTTEQSTGKNNTLNSEPQIQINQSTILGEVEDIYVNDEYNFILKVKILEVEENPAYTSIAVKGSVYNLIPNFQLDENQKVIKESEKNKNLSGLSKLKRRDKFKAAIFFEKLKGWYIQETL
jgi:hypothetical protein